MSQNIVILIVVLGGILVIGAAIVVYFLLFSKSGNMGAAERLRSLQHASKKQTRNTHGAQNVLSKKEFAEQKTNTEDRESIFDPSLRTKIKYAGWTISPLNFRIIQAVTCLSLMFIAWTLSSPTARIGFTLDAFIIGWAVTAGFLDSALEKRSNTFDADYPQLLLSLVSILKTGMTPLKSLEFVAENMEEESIVKREVELLLERIKLGLGEEQSIGLFAEEIFHPEIELFIQAMAMNMRVGGRLSAVMERLSKQVRRRQEFKKKAVSAVALERGSIWAIAGIMGIFFTYLLVAARELIEGIYTTPTGHMIGSAASVSILLGLVWSRNITKLKI